MQTILGPFHPDLENALVDEIAGHKDTDLLCPLLILVPSELTPPAFENPLEPGAALWRCSTCNC